MKPTPAYWDGERWVVHSPSPLSKEQLARIADWLLPVQRARLVGLRPGARRDECLVTIKALEDRKIACGLTPVYNGPDGQGYLPFAATADTGKIIVSMGA